MQDLNKRRNVTVSGGIDVQVASPEQFSNKRPMNKDENLTNADEPIFVISSTEFFKPPSQGIKF